jgi:alpha-galactosidase
MLVVGKLGWGDVRENRLTHDEQITHITLWSLLAAPFLLGCDLTALDEFTIDLMCNDEVLAINQDPAGLQGHCLVDERRTNDRGRVTLHTSVYERRLQDGSIAVGLFNRNDEPAEVTVRWEDLGVTGNYSVRDVWAQEDLGKEADRFTMGVAAHGAQLLLLSGI